MCLIFGFVNTCISQGEKIVNNVYVCSCKRQTEEACSDRR